MSDDYCDSGGGGYDSGGGCDYGGGCDTGGDYSCGDDNGGGYNTGGDDYIVEDVCVYDGGNYDGYIDDGGDVVCEERYTFSSGYENSTGDCECVCSWNTFLYIAAFLASGIIIIIIFLRM